MAARVPYLTALRIVSERKPTNSCNYPLNLPFVRDLDISFKRPVTFFVGENGTGKSTLVEAIADLCRLPLSGGGRNELGEYTERGSVSVLSSLLRPSFRKSPDDAYFFRAEFQASFASLLDTRQNDPDFEADPYRLFGGKSLHQQSHGEAYLAILKNRLRRGLYLLDEPESALSPQRQLALLSLIYERATSGHAQFIIATHSPILMTYPDSQIINFDTNDLKDVRLNETAHYHVTRRILERPGSFWEHLDSTGLPQANSSEN
jgi:predicted ATPase